MYAAAFGYGAYIDLGDEDELRKVMRMLFGIMAGLAILGGH